MFKVIFTFRKLESLSWDEFRVHARDKHAPLVVQLPELRGYVQTLAQDEVAALDSFHGIAELSYENEAAYERSFGSDIGQAVIADAANYAHPASEREIRVEEVARFP
jgi:uncharacterized protein (TIGR02118 family)